MLVNNIKKFIILFFVFLLIGCDEYYFNNQSHRLELNGCKMTYNGKLFYPGMTLEQYIDVFGEYTSEKYKTLYLWKGVGVSVTISDGDSAFSSPEVSIYLNKVNDTIYANNILKEVGPDWNYLKINGVTVSRKNMVDDMVSGSDKAISDLSEMPEYDCGSGYEIVYLYVTKKTSEYLYEALPAALTMDRKDIDVEFISISWGDKSHK